MRKLNWDKICVMVVDDNTFMRNLLANTIKTFGIENTVSEPDCATAIKRLKLSKTDPIAAGIGTIDMIIADYLMEGVDGNLFLHWIRTNQDVPGPFSCPSSWSRAPPISSWSSRRATPG